MTEDPIIKRRDLMNALGVRSSDTIRKMMRADPPKLPAYDVALSQKTCGWRRSTLVAHGVKI